MPTAGQLITTDSILDVFLQNINAVVLAGSHHNASVPTFTGTTLYNTSYTSTATYTAYSNPEAVPAGDLDSYGSAYATASGASIGAKGQLISAATVYDVLCEVTRKMTRVRNFSSSWYHKTGGSLALVATKSGKAIFKESLPALGSFAGTLNTKNCGWERSVNSTLQAIAVDNAGVAKGNVITAANVNTFLSNLTGAWSAAAANSIQYKFYSCHNNCHCHSNCDSRHRR